MSIVAVHGPNTFGSKAITQNSTGSAYATTADGLTWVLRPKDTSQVAANYDWAFTGTGTPSSPIADTKTPSVLFGAGAHTVTLTLNGVAQPSFVITAAAAGPGVSPLSIEAGDEEPPPPDEPSGVYSGPGFDPAAHTVTEVEDYVNEHPEEAEAILALEEEGKARSTLISFLQGRTDEE